MDSYIVKCVWIIVCPVYLLQNAFNVKKLIIYLIFNVFLNVQKDILLEINTVFNAT
jgi:hypothetical protein